MTNRRSNPVSMARSSARGFEILVVTFAVGETEVTQRNYVVRRYLLCGASSVFRKMFQNAKPADGHHIIEIVNVRPEIFEAMLRYVCRRKITLRSWKKAADLLFLAQQFQICGLQEKCEKYLENEITSETVCEAYEFALQHQLQKVMESCGRLFATEAASVIKTNQFLNSYPSTVKALISHMCTCSDTPPYQNNTTTYHNYTTVGGHVILIRLCIMPLFVLLNWGTYKCHQKGLRISSTNLHQFLAPLCTENGHVDVAWSSLVKQFTALKRLNSIQDELSTPSQKSVENYSFEKCGEIINCESWMTSNEITSETSCVISLSGENGGETNMCGAFKTNVISELRIEMGQGSVEITELQLCIKPKLSYAAMAKKVNVLVRFENPAETIDYQEELSDVTFTEMFYVFPTPLPLREKQDAKITVIVEDIQPNRCYSYLNDEQHFTNKDILFTTKLKSNQLRRNSTSRPFLIKQVFYTVC